jgi:glutamine synthetase type III
MAMEAAMISSQSKPKTKHELIRRLNKARISQIEVIEPYDPSIADEVSKTAKAWTAKSGQVSIIILRMP